MVGNPWCPNEKSEAIFNSNDFEALKKRIDEFSLSDGTGNDHGIAWGLNALTPAWRGKLGGNYPARPADFDDDATL